MTSHHTTWSDQAAQYDAEDALASYRELFAFPQRGGHDVAYFCGNSLGLQPSTAETLVREELEDWRRYGVEGHFQSRRPWYSYHRWFAEPLARLVGARPHEVAAMNTLTVNLHLMMTSFYRPTAERHAILLAGGEFPSDRYAIESQIRLHGLDPATSMIEIAPHEGASTLTTEDVLEAIRSRGHETALVLFSGVHFYTGQFFDIAAITRAAHEAGAMAGFDLAHAVGNVELSLHDWDADFAVWCSYKYLNAGPGAVAGLYVHERYADRADLPRLAGWWGNDESTRFSMAHSFDPSYGADGWQLSNAQVLPLALLMSSLEIFDRAGMGRISSKRDQLTGFLERLLHEVIGQRDWIRIITPSDPQHRGAQLSVHFDRIGREIFESLIAHGVIVDWRTPSVIRMAPAPLYTSYADVVRLATTLETILAAYA
jgi:kynureninase